MSYTFLNQQNKLSSLLGDSNTTSDDMFPIAVRQKEINRGEWQLAVDAKDLFGYATGTVSSLTIAVPSDWVDTHVLIVNNVVIDNDREIALQDWQRYYNWGGTDPYYYFWDSGSGTLNINLLGSNANGQTYKLFYFKKPTTELSADSDTSLHQEEFREASVYYAASELMRQIGKAQQAMEYRQVYESFVARADAWARKKYIKKEYARPDFGPFYDFNQTDTQGKSYYGGV